MTKSRRRASVQEKTLAREKAAAATEPDPLWSIAMLRIAMELKRADAPELEQIVAGVIARMGLPDREFRRFINERLALPD